MLIKILPEQVAKFWEVIKHGVSHSLPPTIVYKKDDARETERMNKILTSLLTGVLECWVSFEISEDGKRTIKYIMITQVIFDDILGVKNLFIYSIYGFTQISKEIWIDGFQTLKDYGAKLGCSKLLAFTSFKHLKEMAKKFGGNSDYSLVEFDIREEN